MIDRVDNELLEWLTAQVGVEAVLGPPLGMAAKPAIRVYLLEMTNDPAPRGLNRAPFQVVLKYLITVSDDEPLRAHRLLGEILHAAAKQTHDTDWTLSVEPLSPYIWLGFRVAPQPSLIVGIPLRYVWDQPTTPRVTSAPDYVAGPAVEITGLVLGPGGRPVVGARVELTASGKIAETNTAGRFRLANIPGGEHYPRELLVAAKGQQQVVALEPESAGRPLTINFEFKEM